MLTALQHHGEVGDTDPFVGPLRHPAGGRGDTRCPWQRGGHTEDSMSTPTSSSITVLTGKGLG